jgi:hypothetical protein
VGSARTPGLSPPGRCPNGLALTGAGVLSGTPHGDGHLQLHGDGHQRGTDPGPLLLGRR